MFAEYFQQQLIATSLFCYFGNWKIVCLSRPSLTNLIVPLPTFDSHEFLLSWLLEFKRVFSVLLNISVLRSVLILRFPETNLISNEFLQAEKNCTLNPSRRKRRQRPQIKPAFSNELSNIFTTGKLSDLRFLKRLLSWQLTSCLRADVLKPHDRKSIEKTKVGMISTDHVQITTIPVQFLYL